MLLEMCDSTGSATGQAAPRGIFRTGPVIASRSGRMTRASTWPSSVSGSRCSEHVGADAGRRGAGSATGDRLDALVECDGEAHTASGRGRDASLRGRKYESRGYRVRKRVMRGLMDAGWDWDGDTESWRLDGHTLSRTGRTDD